MATSSFGLVQLDEHAEGRRQVPVGAVQVAGHVAALEAGVAAELELLLDRGAGLLDELLDGLALSGLGGQQGEPVGDLVRQRRLRDLGRQLLELLVLRHEVGLAVQLDQHARAVAVELGGHQAVARRAGGALARVLDALRRRISMAASRSPSASAGRSCSPCIPAPVCSRSRFTSAAEKFAMS